MRALTTATWKLAFAMTMLPESPSGKFGFMMRHLSQVA
jgi:hypothetical protein